MKRIILVIFLFLPIFCYAQKIEVTVDVSQRLEKTPEIFSSSVWIQGLHNPLFNTYILKKFFAENKPATIMWTLRMLRHSKNFDDFKRQLKNFFQTEKAAFLLDKIRENDILLIVGFDPGCMPHWLSSQAGNRKKAFKHQGWTIEPLSPPKDYKKWAEVVEYTLRYLYEKMNIKNLGFYIGHEPGWLWLGTREEFFKYYKYAAEATKRVSKDIKIGGIGLGWIRSKMKTDPSDQPLLKEFLAYVAKHHLPLDFINWHAFGTFPPNFITTAKNIYQWIEEAGINRKNIFLYPADWTYWNVHYGGYPVDYLDTEETAAYIPTALCYMYKAGITHHGHDFDVRDPGFERKVILKRPKSTFIGNWALFTIDGIIKPSYNAFRAISLLNPSEKETFLVSASSDGQMTVIATANEKQVNVLLSNFVPMGKMKFIFLREKLKGEKEFSVIKEELKSLKDKLKATRDKNILNYISSLIEKVKDEEKKKSLELLYKEVQSYIKNRKSPKKVTLYFKNLPFQGKILLTTYTIDKQHSNSCRFNKRTENFYTETPCGIGGEIDRLVLQAKQEAKKAAIRKAEKFLAEEGFSKKQIMQIKQCFEYKKARECLKEIKGIDKRELLKVVKEEYQKIYWAKIDQINTLDEIALEGSKKVQFINIENGRCKVDLEMLPNSIWVVILEEQNES